MFLPSVSPHTHAINMLLYSRCESPNWYCSKSSLPYIDALIQELLRWNIIGPLSLPHRLVQDDEYRGRTGDVYWDVMGC